MAVHHRRGGESYYEHYVSVPEPYNFYIHFSRDGKIVKLGDGEFNLGSSTEYDFDESVIKELYVIFLEQQKIEEEVEKANQKLKEGLEKTSQKLTKYDLINEKLKQEENDLEIFNKGVELVKSGKYIEALILFQRCIDNGYSLNQSNYNVACCYSLLENKDEAIKHLKLTKMTHDFRWMDYLNDPDLTFIMDTPEFVKIIEGFLIETENEGKVYDLDAKYLGKRIVDYLTKHNLITYLNEDERVFRKIKKHMTGRAHEFLEKLDMEGFNDFTDHPLSVKLIKEIIEDNCKTRKFYLEDYSETVRNYILKHNLEKLFSKKEDVSA